MAEISTELAIINDITTALSTIPDAVYDIVPAVQQAFDISIIQNMTKNMYQFEDDIIDVDYRIMDMNDDLTKVEEQTQKVAQKGDLLSSIYKKVASAAKRIDIKDVLNKSDELTQTMSRLNNINDGSQSTSELFDMIYASAKNARAPLMSTADAIITMGSSTGDLFGSNQELVDFMNQLNKHFAIGGASATEQSSALDQLTDSMASGAIKGSEMNKILEAAPGIASTIEKNMGWAEGSLMSYAEQGKVTSEVVKASLLNMSNKTNESFADIPLTFSQVMTNIQSDATKIFQPVLDKLSNVTQSEIFVEFITNATNALSVVANITMAIMDSMETVAGFIYDNWSVISPLIYGAITALGIYMLALGAYRAIQVINGIQKVISTVQEYAHAKAVLANAEAEEDNTVKTAEATVAQASFNTTLLASPVTWITIAIIALVVALVAFANWIAKTTGIAETGFGVICGWVNIGIQWFKNLGLVIANVALGIRNALCTCADNIGIAFGNAISGVKAWFYDLLSTSLNVIAEIMKELNKLPFVEIDYSGIVAKADEFAAKAEDASASKEEYKDVRDAFNEGNSTYDTFVDGWEEQAMANGVAWGDNVAGKFGDLISGFELPGYNSGEYDLGVPDSTAEDIAATADNTASLNDSVDISNENLKYLKDVAERDAINRFTTAQIKVNMNNNNNISNGMDLDGVINYLTAGVTEAMGQAAEGVHA